MHQTVATLCQSLGVAMETLDADTVLVDRVQLGTAWLMEELQAMEPEIAVGRVGLQSNVTGFAASEIYQNGNKKNAFHSRYFRVPTFSLSFLA